MISTGKKPSEIIEEFVNYLTDTKELYEMAKNKCREYDSVERHIYWAHKFEFAKDKQERNKLATAYQKERKERRRYKNICDTYEAVYKFITSDNNKSTLKRMRGMINEQRREEKYVEGERVYKAGEEHDSD